MDTTKVKEIARPVRAQASSNRTLAANTRVSEEAAFVLHSYPYKETSLIIDILTRSQGRLALVAREAPALGLARGAFGVSAACVKLHTRAQQG